MIKETQRRWRYSITWRLLSGVLRNFGGDFDEAAMAKRIQVLEEAAVVPDLWSDRARAESILREKRVLERELSLICGMEQSLEDAVILLSLIHI